MIALETRQYLIYIKYNNLTLFGSCLWVFARVSLVSCKLDAEGLSVHQKIKNLFKKATYWSIFLRENL